MKNGSFAKTGTGNAHQRSLKKGGVFFPCWAGNCANFMMKSVNISAIDNVVADSNYTGVVSKTNNPACPFLPLCAEKLSLSS